MKCPNKLTVSVTRYPRVIEVTQIGDGQYEFRGMYAKYLEILLSAWKGGYQLKFCEDEDLGTKDKNGTWTGQIGMVSRGEADIGMSLIGILEQRTKVVDFSVAYSMEAISFASYKMPLEGMFQFLQLFDLATWIAIFITLIILSLVLFLILKGKNTFSFIFFNTYSNVLGKSLLLHKNVLKWKPFLALWFLCAFVMSSSYSAVLLSFLTLSPPSKTLHTLNDVADAIRKGLRAFSGKHTFIVPFLINSKDEDLRFIGTSIAQNEWYHDWQATFAGKMIQPKDIYFSSRNMLKLLFGNIKSIHISENVLFVVPIGVAMNKNFRCVSHLNDILLRMAAAGLEGNILSQESYKFWVQNFDNLIERKENPLALSMHDLVGAFIIFLIGLTISLLAFSAEVFYGYIHRVKMQKKHPPPLKK
ncbi:lig_chan-Glu_bd domain-containing protein [Trichonephila inaurata madagascariensis]|uniref:Lig_chan-Glu_bd domain-containing protein n=1 Tax=Trichonephila inaurata madagascariensis TaxID=2747483 RepID=A0A8X7BUW2_9ARAC|nr:lig_chan-Glu_bd domain-containing protein [Trichonephila inaurata madagascariensis]